MEVNVLKRIMHIGQKWIYRAIKWLFFTIGHQQFSELLCTLWKIGALLFRLIAKIFWMNDISKAFLNCDDSMKDCTIQPTKLAPILIRRGNHFCVIPNDCHREPGVFEQVKTFLAPPPTWLPHPKRLVWVFKCIFNLGYRAVNMQHINSAVPKLKIHLNTFQRDCATLIRHWCDVWRPQTYILIVP